MLISGPKQPDNDIDVFLEPFMEEMEMLFDVGVQMVDAYRKEKFTLKAIIFVTIIDYPGLFSLQGRSKRRPAVWFASMGLSTLT
jgi:putative N-acetylmannosamine-6-phosphate epimerase